MGGLLVWMILGMGIYVTVITRGVQFRKLGTACRAVLGGGKRTAEQGQLGPLQTLATALSSCLGTGNIAGVAGALVVGGPGAIFWMWVSAVLGMAVKYAEILLGMRFRKQGADGLWRGGAMFILSGVKRQKRLARLLSWVFAASCVLASLISCNAVQSNAVAGALQNSMPNVPLWVWGTGLAVLTALVVLGGIRKIGSVCTVLTPLMSGLYLAFGLLILLLRADQIPSALASIFRCAFRPDAAFGGITGITMQKAMTLGIARGVFSNEAGMGAAAMIHASSDISVPARQSLFGIVEVFFDTIVFCTVTALILLTTGVGTQLEIGTVAAENPAAVAERAWVCGLGGIGGLVVTVVLLLCAFSSIVGWAWCGETAFVWLFGEAGLRGFRMIYVVFTFLGCVLSSSLLWHAADLCNTLMCIPNLASLLWFSGTIRRDTRQFIDEE